MQKIYIGGFSEELSNHYENITRYLIQSLKTELLIQVTNKGSSEYFEIPARPCIVLAGFDLNDTNSVYDEDPEVEVVGSEIRQHNDYSLDDMEFEIQIYTERKLELIDYTDKLKQWLMKHRTITVDNNEYDLDIITPFSNRTIPNLSNLKIIAGGISISQVKVVSDEYVVKVETEEKEITTTKK